MWKLTNQDRFKSAQDWRFIYTITQYNHPDLLSNNAFREKLEYIGELFGCFDWKLRRSQPLLPHTLPRMPADLIKENKQKTYESHLSYHGPSTYELAEQSTWVREFAGLFSGNLVIFFFIW